MRILLQSGWSEISTSSFEKMTASAAEKARADTTAHRSLMRKERAREEIGMYDAMLIGALPHDWLFPFVRAVIHHGGAGIPIHYGRPGID